MRLFALCLGLLFLACSPPDFIEVSDTEFAEFEPLLAPAVLKGTVEAGELDSIQFISDQADLSVMTFRVLRGCERVELLLLQDGQAVASAPGCAGVTSAPVDFNGRLGLVIRGAKKTTYKIEATASPASF